MTTAAQELKAKIEAQRQYITAQAYAVFFAGAEASTFHPNKGHAIHLINEGKLSSVFDPDKIIYLTDRPTAGLPLKKWSTV